MKIFFRSFSFFEISRGLQGNEGLNFLTLEDTFLGRNIMRKRQTVIFLNAPDSFSSS